ncbi:MULTISPECIES: YcjX family GTP-binding protein [Vibrio]|uniref:YcjX family protein n=2 Tax=Vibrio TaxID=662 RepID=A0A7X4RV24_9VIBR|nr:MULTISPECIES: YcjX family protein [Vibrio]MBF9000597.1 YcjX family protein [Vibrio nitrifigilis]MZI93877.1 YcjX family protein [Vibrio eleionomae]
MKSISKEVTEFMHRSTDSHVRLAVTGLSRAGKTAFITSLVNQLLNSATHDNLPLLAAARDKRVIGARRVPQTNLMVPRFTYDEACGQLYANPPIWPEPTRDVSEIRLAIRYRPKKRTKRLMGSTATLYLDIIDYPGEWLLDLPLLDMDFATWSEQQYHALHGKRKELAQPWLDSVAQLDLDEQANEQVLAQLAEQYTEYLHQCKAAGLHWVQPGRFVLPGELSGAPVLQFFPVDNISSAQVTKGSYLELLQARYKEYQEKVVKRFYRKYFSTFDRQIVLVDCLTPLNTGFDAFMDMRSALEQLMHSFRYGRSGLLSRLFSPKIDKVLFAATKADHITPDQHVNLVSLLQQMVHPAWQHAAYENIDMSCISMASVRSTISGYIQQGERQQSAVQGTTQAGDNLTLYPGDVPAKLPNPDYWDKHQFEFTQFKPLPTESDAALAHIRLDKALEILLGDKLR